MECPRLTHHKFASTCCNPTRSTYPQSYRKKVLHKHIKPKIQLSKSRNGPTVHPHLGQGSDAEDMDELPLDGCQQVSSKAKLQLVHCAQRNLAVELQILHLNPAETQLILVVFAKDISI